MKHAVIYVPGIGDHRYIGQRLLIQTWRLWGVKPVMVRMVWHEGKSFAPKLRRLLHAIDALNTAGYTVSLVGASAGAGAVINAFAERIMVVNGVVCLAGKIHRPEAIGASYQQHSPAFVESAYRVQASLDRLDFDTERPRIQSRYATVDLVVPKEDSEISGARNTPVITMGHALTIGTQLLFGAPSFLRWLRKLPSRL